MKGKNDQQGGVHREKKNLSILCRGEGVGFLPLTFLCGKMLSLLSSSRKVPPFMWGENQKKKEEEKI